METEILDEETVAMLDALIEGVEIDDTMTEEQVTLCTR